MKVMCSLPFPRIKSVAIPFLSLGLTAPSLPIVKPQYKQSCPQTTVREEEKEERNALMLDMWVFSCHIRESLTDINTFISL